MAKLVDHSQQDWQPVRADLTRGVTGKLLLAGPTRMVLTRVTPGGIFQSHRDSYGHLFHVLKGVGAFSAGEHEYQLTAGMSLQVAAGELHGYRNSGSAELLLLSLNLPTA